MTMVCFWLEFLYEMKFPWNSSLLSVSPYPRKRKKGNLRKKLFLYSFSCYCYISIPQWYCTKFWGSYWNVVIKFQLYTSGMLPNAAQRVDYGPTNQCSRIVGLCKPVIKKCAISSFAYLMRGREMSCFSRVERWKCQPETKVLWRYWWSSGWDSVLPM